MDENSIYQNSNLPSSTKDAIETLVELTEYSQSVKAELLQIRIDIERFSNEFTDAFEILGQIDFYTKFIEKVINDFQLVCSEIRFQIFSEHINLLKTIYNLSQKYYQGYYREGYGFDKYFGLIKDDNGQGNSFVSRLGACQEVIHMTSCLKLVVLLVLFKPLLT